MSGEALEVGQPSNASQFRPTLQRFRVFWALMSFVLFYDLAFLDGRLFYANVRRAIVASTAILLMAASGIVYSILMIFQVLDVQLLSGVVMGVGCLLLVVAAWGRRVEAGFNASPAHQVKPALSILLDLRSSDMADFVSRTALLAEEYVGEGKLQEAGKLVELAQTIWFFCILQRHPILRGMLRTQSQYLRSMEESVGKFMVRIKSAQRRGANV